MINDETKKKLRELKLGELINAYEIYSKNTDWSELPFEQQFQMMADYLYQDQGKLILHVRWEDRPVSRDTLRNIFVCLIFWSRMMKKKFREETQNVF